MKPTLRNFFTTTLLFSALAVAPANMPAPEKTFAAPNNQTISIKMIGPVTQDTDLQILCILKHAPAGDQYIEAMDDFNKKLGRLASTIRETGAFAGESGETFLFTPPANSITPKRVLFIGVGDEKDLTLDKLKIAGRIAARESVRLGARHVSFAPTLRDQGSTRIDVGLGDAAFVEDWISAYDTEIRLQQQQLAPIAVVVSLTIEAGPKYFDGAAQAIEKTIAAASQSLKSRSNPALFQP